jgi:hypothetical protein
VGVPAGALALWAGTGLTAMVATAGVAFSAAGASAGAKFAAAFVPVVLTALASFGLGTMIADAIGMEKVGEDLYDKLHPQETALGRLRQTRRGMGGPLTMAQALAEEAAAVEAQNRAAGGFNMEADAASQGTASKFRATEPVKGKIVVEVRNGKASVESVDVSGPIDLGANVGP